MGGRTGAPAPRPCHCHGGRRSQRGACANGGRRGAGRCRLRATTRATYAACSTSWTSRAPSWDASRSTSPRPSCTTSRPSPSPPDACTSLQTMVSTCASTPSGPAWLWLLAASLSYCSAALVDSSLGRRYNRKNPPRLALPTFLYPAIENRLLLPQTWPSVRRPLHCRFGVPFTVASAYHFPRPQLTLSHLRILY